MSHFLGKWVKLSTIQFDSPLDCKILRVITEPGENVFYEIELENKARLFIAASDVSWVQTNRKKSGVLKIVPSAKLLNLKIKSD